MQVRSPCKWVCYPHGSLLLVWRYYISRSLASIAHFEVFRRQYTTTTVQMSRPALPHFAICVRCSSPLAKWGIFPLNVFSFVMVSVSSYTVSYMLPPRRPKGKSLVPPCSATLCVVPPECCSPSLDPTTMSAERIYYYFRLLFTLKRTKQRQRFQNFSPVHTQMHFKPDAFSLVQTENEAHSKTSVICRKHL